MPGGVRVETPLDVCEFVRKQWRSLRLGRARAFPQEDMRANRDGVGVLRLGYELCGWPFMKTHPDVAIFDQTMHLLEFR